MRKQPLLLDAGALQGSCSLHVTCKILQLFVKLNLRACICSFAGLFVLFFFSRWKQILSVYTGSEREWKEKEMEIFALFLKISNTDISEPVLPRGMTVNNCLTLKKTS